MSIPLIDEFAIRTIGLVAERGDNTHLRACRKILCPLMRFIYGKDFCDIVAISSLTGFLQERYESLSRFTTACPRVFVLVEVYDNTTNVAADLLITGGGRVCLTTYARKYTRCAQLMITGLPYRILGMPCNQSSFEVIDVDQVIHIRFLIWVGKQLTVKTESSFLDVYQGEILPKVLDQQNKLSCKKQRVFDIPLARVCPQIR